jgi:DNA repair protein SbcD/Mre11
VRLLHTSDWHIGRSIRGRSRADELAAVIDEVFRIAVDERVDALLLAGDVYEHRTAAPEADGLLFETFVRFSEAGIPMVVISGNHDSPAKLKALRPLLRPLQVHVVPTVMRPEEGGIIRLYSRDESETAQIACIPFVPERRYGDAAQLFESSEKWFQSYADGLGSIFEGMAASFRADSVNIVMAHVFADGALLGGGEREISVGMAYTVPPSRLPGTAHYVALGHVHRPQSVRGAPTPTRYSGSLLQLDFGEVDQSKSVCIVDTSPGQPARVREVKLGAGRRLMDLDGSLDDLRSMEERVGDAYLRVTVRTEGPVPGIADAVREALPNAVEVRLDYPRLQPLNGGPRLSSLAPLEQFVSYYRKFHAAEPHPDLVEAFNEVLEQESEEM